MTYILDTNVLIRFLVGGHAGHLATSRTWFKEAQEGKRKLVLSAVVVAESAFVLEKVYGKTRREIALALGTVVSQRFIEVQERGALIDLWKWYLEGFHFVDSYLMALAKHNEAIVLTFDCKVRKTV